MKADEIKRQQDIEKTFKGVNFKKDLRFSKSKNYAVGSVSTWSDGKKYRKEADGSWVPIQTGKPGLPPHLQAHADRYEAKKKEFKITDVTPKGYGPNPNEGIDYNKKKETKIASHPLTMEGAMNEKIKEAVETIKHNMKEDGMTLDDALAKLKKESSFGPKTMERVKELAQGDNKEASSNRVFENLKKEIFELLLLKYSDSYNPSVSAAHATTDYVNMYKTYTIEDKISALKQEKEDIEIALRRKGVKVPDKKKDK